MRSSTDHLELRIFTGDDCQADATDPWFSWRGCDDDGLVNYCRELPYSVGSIQLQIAARGSDRECMVAAERGVAVRGRLADLTMALVGVVFALVMGSM